MLDLFEEIVLDIWRQKQALRSKEKSRLEKELRALEEKRSNLIDVLLQHTIDEETYKLKAAEIGTEILAKKAELDENITELNDDVACVRYCKYFTSNIAKLWEKAELNTKQRFQQFIFPNKIFYNGDLFRTEGTALIFRHIEAISDKGSRLAALTYPILELLRSLFLY